MFKSYMQSVVLVAAFAALAGCAHEPRGEPKEIYERSSHHLEQAPAAAAQCIARNASKAEHQVPDVQPLYGTDVMSVSIQTIPAGGNRLATIILTSDNPGSRAAVTTSGDFIRDRQAFVKALTEGC